MLLPAGYALTGRHEGIGIIDGLQVAPLVDAADLVLATRVAANQLGTPTVAETPEKGLGQLEVRAVRVKRDASGKREASRVHPRPYPCPPR